MKLSPAASRPVFAHLKYTAAVMLLLLYEFSAQINIIIVSLKALDWYYSLFAKLVGTCYFHRPQPYVFLRKRIANRVFIIIYYFSSKKNREENNILKPGHVINRHYHPLSVFLRYENKKLPFAPDNFYTIRIAYVWLRKIFRNQD